jgi:hypothetical protein
VPTAGYSGSKWKPKANKEAIQLNEEVLATTSRRRTVHFVHVKGHSDNEGNDCVVALMSGSSGGRTGGRTAASWKEATKGQDGLDRWRRTWRSLSYPKDMYVKVCGACEQASIRVLGYMYIIYIREYIWDKHVLVSVLFS